MQVLQVMRGCVALIFAVLLPAPGMMGSASAATSPAPADDVFDQESALRISQAAIGRQPGDYTLLDRRGNPVRLSEYRGKPLLVSFIYTGCFQVCPTNTRSLSEAVQDLEKLVGLDKFNVVSIGFNQPFDSPQAMRVFAAQNSISAPNWEFLSPHASIVEPLTRDFGFSFKPTSAGFDHVLEVTVLDAQGRIYSQIYGDRLAPNQLGEPVRQLLSGAPLPQSVTLGELIERVRILCTVYDPETGRYRYNYSLILEIFGGAMFFLAMLWFLASEWLQHRRTSRS